MRYSHGRIGALGLLVLLSGTEADAGVRLRYKGEAGAAAVYKLAVNGQTTVAKGDRQSGRNLGSEVFLTQTIERVLEDGSIQMRTTVSSGAKTVDGQASVSPAAGRVSFTKLSPLGAVEVQGQGSAAAPPSAMQLVFPDGPVEVGTTWSNTAPPTKEVPVAVETTYKVLGKARVADHDCVRIATRVRSVGEANRPGVQVKMEASGTIHFSPDEGRLIDSEVKASLEMRFGEEFEGQEAQEIRVQTNMDARIAWQYDEGLTAQGD